MRTELEKYWKIFLKRIWISILLPLIAIITAWYLSQYVFEPVYESNVSLIVVNEQAESDVNDSSLEYYNLLVMEQLVKDYEEIIKSRTVTEKVIEEIKMNNFTPAQLAKNITVESKNGTSILEIKVKGKNPDEAKEIANKISEVFEEKILLLFNNKKVKIIDYANIPTTPVSPKTKINIVLAAFAGLFLAIIVILLIEYLDDTVKTTEELERRLGLSVLGIIPDLNLK